MYFLNTHSIFTGNNVLDVHASNTDGLLSRDTFVSSTQGYRPVQKK
jgi:hypothetical protein